MTIYDIIVYSKHKESIKNYFIGFLYFKFEKVKDMKELIFYVDFETYAKIFRRVGCFYNKKISLRKK